MGLFYLVNFRIFSITKKVNDGCWAMYGVFNCRNHQRQMLHRKGILRLLYQKVGEYCFSLKMESLFSVPKTIKQASIETLYRPALSTVLTRLYGLRVLIRCKVPRWFSVYSSSFLITYMGFKPRRKRPKQSFEWAYKGFTVSRWHSLYFMRVEEKIETF